MSEENKRLAILDELDQFNTAPEADSLMLGILQEQENARQPITRADDSDPADTTAPDGDNPELGAGKEHADPYLPLNTSIQEVARQQTQFEQRFSNVERTLQSLHSAIASHGQQTQQPQQPQYDPDMPVTMQHVSTLAQRQEMAYQMGLRAYKSNLATRAHLEYQRFQAQHPDFQFDPQQIDHAIEAMARDGKLDQLEGTNWRGHFEQMYAPQRESRFESQAKQIEVLQKELESLKKQAVRTAPPAQPVSPSTGRSSRGPAAISSPLEKTGEDDIANMKTFRQKGNFKGFANDLKLRAQAK